MGENYAENVKEAEKDMEQSSGKKHSLSITLDKGFRTTVRLDGVDIS